MLKRTASAMIAFAFTTPLAIAHGDDTKILETVTVYGRGMQMLGEASAASEGVVGYADFEDRPLSRAGELVEVIPGAVATQHSGEGKANQYFLRGFNLDHGTDFSASVDGVPVNMRTHGHGQGYLDLNFIIPEVMERVDYAKGPYSADVGDFSSAGSARYTTMSDLDQNFVQIGAGENGYLRGVAAAVFHPSNESTLLGALEVQAYDGPWTLDQDLEKVNAFGKYVHDGMTSRWEVVATGYDSSWTSTDQIPQRAVTSGLIDRFGFIDPDLGGETSRYSLAANASFRHGLGTRTQVSGYIVDYDFSLWSNFTYFLDDPVNGDEFEQRDSRTYYGGSVVHKRRMSDRWRIAAGLEARYDDIDEVGLYRTAARTRLSTIRTDAVEELSASAWVEAETDLTDGLRATFGLRGDVYDAEVDAISLPENGGSADDSLLSPSAGLAWRATDKLEIYANYGQGFHSNDVRGATVVVDPASGEPASPVPILVQSDGFELGARWQTQRFNATLALFQLDLESELVFVGDAGTTEPNDASTRRGVEASLFWRPNDWLVLDAGGAFTDAEFDISGDETEIPGAVESVLSAGAVARFNDLTLTARLRHFGEAPLIEDGSVTSDPTSIVNLGARYAWGNVTFGLDVLNALDADDADITYFFESQLTGESDPVEDFHFHPVEPRQLRASLRYAF